jgi:hypothetical protein
MTFMDVFAHFPILRRKRRGIQPVEIQPANGANCRQPQGELRLRGGEFRKEYQVLAHEPQPERGVSHRVC